MTIHNPVTQILLPAAVVLVMFALGSTLTARDLRRVLDHPRAFVAGLSAHTFILPVLALALGLAVPLAPETAVGLAIIAACPASSAANIVTHLARGDTMLSVSLTAGASLLSALTLPAWVNLALRLFPIGPATPHLPFLASAVGLFLISALPVAVGMYVRRARPTVAARIEARMNVLGLLVLLAVVGAVVWSVRDSAGPALVASGMPSLVLNVVAVILGWSVSAVVGLPPPQRVAVALECGLQNFALASFVSLTLLENEALLLPAIAYGLTMWLSAIVVVAASRRAPESPAQTPS